jgi:GntR family transcriptional regulator / MocR family aminotransferase
VTNGSQQAIDLLTRVLLAPGDTVAVEDPGYPLPRRAFGAHGCRVIGVPVDAEGLVVDAIPSRARLAYVTPSHQYPLGMAMSMGRRQALLAWANRVNGIIVEDDYDSEFRFGGRALEPLHSLDTSGRVLYVGSFSKVLMPTLRLGFLVAPTSLSAALRKAKHLADWHTAVATQGAVAHFIEDGLFAQHLRRMRRVYAERHHRVRSVLEAVAGDRLTALPSAGGLHLAVQLRGRGGTTDRALAEAAHRLGVAVLPLSRCYLSGAPRAGFLIGYGAIPTGNIEAGLRRLRRCL